MRGDLLLTENGEKVYVKEVRIEKSVEPVKVYNLEVDELHTYFVAGGVLVHNMCSSGSPEGDGSSGTTGNNAESGSNTNVKVDSYNNMSHDSNVSGQAHHLSQDAAFRDVIPTNDGLCVELKGNAFVDIGSGHYEAHKYMETFWNQYRKGGNLYGEIPTIGTYNSALYNSLKAGGLNNKNAAYAVRRAYGQQMSYGLSNADLVPRIPGRINQRK